MRGLLGVIFDQVIELSLRGDVRFDPESDQDHAATQYVAMGPEQKWRDLITSSTRATAALNGRIEPSSS
jgi:hypothetical protein